MNRVRTLTREQVIVDLERAVADAVEFFAHAPENMRDGNQTAREVISHLVFWHREYARIATALAQHQPLRLTSVPFRYLNAQATEIFARESLPALARQLAQLQNELECALAQIPNWRMNFPVKTDIQFCTIKKRVSQTTAHVRGHIQRLKRTEKRYAND